MTVLTAAMAALSGCVAAEPRTPVTMSVRAVEPDDPARFWAAEEIADWPLERKLARLLMVHRSGTNPETLRSFVAKWQPGGFVLMGDNIASSDAGVRRTTQGILSGSDRVPVLIAIDQEGGLVARLHDSWDTDPRNLRNKSAAAVEKAVGKRAARLADLGISINFGIVADVSGDPGAFIAPRVLGTAPSTSAPRVAAAVRGEQQYIASTVKHFPGHGAALGDSHVSIPTTSMSKSRWRESHALPFIAAIEADVRVIMTGHLRYSAVSKRPASLSPEWHQILRDELGYDGLVITDDMLMLQRSGVAEYSDGVKNARMALNAGADMLLFVLGDSAAQSNGLTVNRLIQGLVKEVEAGRLDETVVDERLIRVVSFAKRGALLPSIQ